MVICMGLAWVVWSPVMDRGAEAQTFKLTYSSFFPEDHTQSKLTRAWCKEVETRTKGRVKIQFFPGGALTKPPQCYDGVVKGISDLGQSVPAYTAGRFPVMDAVGLPLGYSTGRVATGVVNEVYRHFKPKEFDETEVMYFTAHGPGFIHTRSKPVRRLEDLKGLRLRTQGNSELLVRQLGGIPINRTQGEAYAMLQKGELDGDLHPLNSNQAWKMGEVVKSVTTSYSVAYTALQFVVMNKNKWKAFPEDIKRTIREINNEWVPQHGEAWDSIDMEGMRYLLDMGGQIIGLDSTESARWKRMAAPVIDDYVRMLNEKGLNGREIVDFTINTLNSMQ
jgi:TRAP-type transport system periplasmic protein